MDPYALVVQLLNGWASASSLFLVACGLSLIFGVSRIVNFAHGSVYMLGLYFAYSLEQWLTPHLGAVAGFWLSMPLAALLGAALGAVCEIVVLRRIYRSPELFQLLATFALVLIIQDAVLWGWGADELLGPRAPGLPMSVAVAERFIPGYDLFLIVAGPLVLWGLHQLLQRTSWGILIRAATHDREMVSALGVPQHWLFTSVFALGCGLAALGGALQLPREPAHLGLDLQTIGEAFVVVVVGGMGSLKGAYLAALLIAQVKTACIAMGTVEWWGMSWSMSKLTLVMEFIIMAIVLVVRPWGLMGQPIHTAAQSESLTVSPGLSARVIHKGWWLLAIGALLVLPLMTDHDSYTLVLLIDMLCSIIFACSLYFVLGPAGLHSFGHAAYFGLGAYAVALLALHWAAPMWLNLLLAPWLSALAALIIGWFCVRLSGVYLAMLTLAMGQIIWSIIYQWDSLTGGSNGLTGVWPDGWWASRPYFYELVLLVSLACVGWVYLVLHSPLGYSARATRDAPARAAALGIPTQRVQWMAFVISGFIAGVGGALFAYSKGGTSPDVLSIARSVDGLIMVLLGGVNVFIGPLVGAISLTWLEDVLARSTDYWHAVLGLTLLFIVIVWPQGLASIGQRLFQRRR
jgi:branched-chain amino acid transport system permease protein